MFNRPAPALEPRAAPQVDHFEILLLSDPFGAARVADERPVQGLVTPGVWFSRLLSLIIFQVECAQKGGKPHLSARS